MEMKVLKDMFGVRMPIISVVHLLPLPGAPLYDDSPVQVIAKKAVEEAVMLADAGINGLIVENFGDRMFNKRVGPEVVAALTVVAKEVKAAVGIPIGINVLQSDAVAAIAIAKAVGATFIRSPYYTETSIVDTGLMDSIAAEALRFRRYIGADVKIFADVHSKHSYPLMQRPIEYSAEDAFVRGLADAVVITGLKTGGETNPDDVIRVRKALPESTLIVGGGVTTENMERYWDFADAIIVASSFNYEGKIKGTPDPARVKAFMSQITKLRNRG